MKDKLIIVFDPKRLTGKNSEENLCKSAREISKKIAEYLNTSSFLIAMDSIQSGSTVSLINDDKIAENQEEVDSVKV